MVNRELNGKSRYTISLNAANSVEKKIIEHLQVSNNAAGEIKLALVEKIFRHEAQGELEPQHNGKVTNPAKRIARSVDFGEIGDFGGAL